LKAYGVLMGRGINHQIRNAYGYLASRYRPGDKIFLLGFSRGAYAVRSLAGIIDLIGLLRADQATERNIRTAYRHYECTQTSSGAKAFAETHCHDKVAPVVWRLSIARNAFHNHELGASVKHGYQALALDENRVAYSPVMWDSETEWPGHVEQMWFRGVHADIGGQLGRYKESRPLANISLVWILEKAESCGLPLPSNWQARFPQDVNAPSVGTWRGLAGLFIMRKKRIVGAGSSDFLLVPTIYSRLRLLKAPAVSHLQQSILTSLPPFQGNEPEGTDHKKCVRTQDRTYRQGIDLQNAHMGNKPLSSLTSISAASSLFICDCAESAIRFWLCANKENSSLPVTAVRAEKSPFTIC